MKFYMTLVLFSATFNYNDCFSADEQKFAKALMLEKIQPAVEQGEVWGDEEASYSRQIADIFKKTLIEATGNNPLMKRDAHPKAHGCVTAHLLIDNSKLPKELQVGLFERNAKYNSIVRFSNGDPNPNKDDASSDVRGMAIKILNVPYKSYLETVGADVEKNNHDIVTMSADEFFLDNPEDYLDFMNATRGRFGVLQYLSLHWLSLKRILTAFKSPANPLDLNYGSATPYKLGATNMKMKFRSCRVEKDEKPNNPGPNFLGEKLLSSLSKNEECFDFYLQPNKDLKNNDIEKAMTVWEQDNSPPIFVGKLIISKQNDFRSTEKMQACEAMTFNPWRAHPSNRPMGGVNRVRLEVYLKQFKLRQDYNKSH